MLQTKPTTIALRSYHLESCAHQHDYHQWVFPISGDLALEIGHHSRTVTEGLGAFIPANEKHVFASNTDNLFLVFNLDSKINWLNQTEIPLFWEIDPAINKFLHFAYCYLKQEHQNLQAPYLIGDFLNKLLMEKFVNNKDLLICKIKNWIEINTAHPINLKQLASQCHLSTSQLQRRFKKVLGQSIGEYWRMKRLEHAKSLLNNPNIHVATIAYDVGYENLAAFTRAFSKQFDLTPTEWRKMHFSANKKPLESKALR